MAYDHARETFRFAARNGRFGLGILRLRLILGSRLSDLLLLRHGLRGRCCRSTERKRRAGKQDTARDGSITVTHHECCLDPQGRAAYWPNGLLMGDQSKSKCLM